MIETKSIFDERKQEIEFYYSILLDMEQNNKNIINTIDNTLFFKIMKSNFLLMLYNIVEATVTTGMLEIYDQLMSDSCTYSSLILELQNIWRDNKVKEVFSSSSELKAYTKRVKKVVDIILDENPLDFNKTMLNINGNLNAQKIKKICDEHCIRYQVIDDDMKLEKVRKKRNSLAHGDESFSNCARDLTITDLENIKDTIFSFLNGIIEGMSKYCTEKQYLKTSNQPTTA